MPDRLHPKSLDHVALWVTDRDAIAAFLCTHLGMHEIDRTDRFTLAGVDARRGKITLFDAEGPREQGVLERIVLRVADLERATAALPDDLAVERVDGIVAFEGPGGVPLGLVERPGMGPDYDLDHVVLRVSATDDVAQALAQLGFDDSGDGHMTVADKHLRLENGGRPEGERPLLNHLAVLVDSARDTEETARALKIEVADVVDAKNTLAVFLWAADRIKVEYVEHKPTFSLT